MSDDVTLEPCPFCDSAAFLIPRPTPGTMLWQICCEWDGCGVQTAKFTSEEKAITAWNTRHRTRHEAALDVSDRAQNDAVRELLRESLFKCETCQDESNCHPLDDLALAPNGVPTCSECWDFYRTKGQPDWDDLPDYRTRFALPATPPAPVEGVERPFPMLDWQDTREVRFDDSVVMGHGYDWDGWENFREEAQGVDGGYAVWPDRNYRNERVWSACGGSMGTIWFQRFTSEHDAKSAVERHSAALRATASPVERDLLEDVEAIHRHGLVAMLAHDENWVYANIPDHVIEAGIEALERIQRDQDNYVSGVTPDWDEGMLSAEVFRSMLRAALGDCNGQ